MTMTDIGSSAPKPKRKYKRRKQAKRTVPAAPKVQSEFPGMTINACSSACNVDRCAVSGRGYCAHPTKGALQGADLHNPGTVERLNRARKMLGIKTA